MTTVFAEDYNSLWKRAGEAERKDLPRTQYGVLMQIVEKAQQERQYGQLMAAELAASRVMVTISPDSLQPAVDRMEQRRQAAADRALATVYAVVLRKIYADNRQLEPRGDLTVTLDTETCRQLAAVKATAYKPLTVPGRNSSIFDNDLLSVVGYELEDFRALNSYYTSTGNRRAMLMTALEMARQERPQGQTAYANAPYISTLDALADRYGDVEEVGEVAIERYEYMKNHTDATPAERWQYLGDALSRWGSRPRMNVLRNAQRDMTVRQFHAELSSSVGMPGQEQTMRFSNLRNIDKVTYRVYRADVKGDTDLNPSDDKDYRKLKTLLAHQPAATGEVDCKGHPVYELFEDSVVLKGLPVGVYLVEMESVPATTVSRQLYFVSDVRIMTEALPDNSMRYVAVDAAEGQPLKGVTIELRGFTGGRGRQLLATLTTDDRGEATYRNDKHRATELFAYTKTDNACPPANHYGGFSFYDNKRRVEQTELFTDRAIYRPGQTVHVAAISYEVVNGFEQQAVEGKQLTLTLRDANHKVVAEQQLTSDKYGTCATDFTLPAGGLTGPFSIQTANGSVFFRVEAYKRPTFEVTFDKVTADYHDGDTVVVKGTARSYAGVPVGEAKVRYEVVRRRAFWWWSYSHYWNRGYAGEGGNEETVVEGEAMTAADGTFTVAMPMVLPKTDFPMFYQFVCQADVTDQAGETHQGQLSLPLGNRKTALSCDLPRQIRADQLPKVTFNLRNAAGNDIDATLQYRINRLPSDDLGEKSGRWQTAPTNTLTAVFNSPYKSGKYLLEAICQGDTVRQAFVVFSLDDKRPATVTDDWFYQSATQFPGDGSPVTVQVGSSAENVHIVYSIISGNRVIESGAIDRSNELVNRKLTYKEDYGNGVLLTFAWMKQGRCYTHNASIQRPLPDKQLKLQWQTFRDRLTPGQQETWTLKIAMPENGRHAPLAARHPQIQLLATLYDKSLDQIAEHRWALAPYQSVALPYTQWMFRSWGSLLLSGYRRQEPLKVTDLAWTRFDESLFPQQWMATRNRGMIRIRGAKPMMAAMSMKAVDAEERAAVMDEGYAMKETAVMGVAANDVKGTDDAIEVEENGGGAPAVQLRENLQETAFFYPQLTADSTGLVRLTFTLPESLTTWRFMGLAHTPDLCYGAIEGEAVAKKDLMVQPNMPRFLREGDEATIAARIVNTSDHELSGTAYLTLADPDTDQTVLSQEVPFTVAAGETTSAAFAVDGAAVSSSLLIARVSAVTETFSDGEQHYLPILPNRERVTVTVPFTQNGPGTRTIDLAKLFPATGADGRTTPDDDATQASSTANHQKLTIEYTNSPAWLMIQALPAIGHPHDDCVVCQAASLYANSIGKHIMDQLPQAKQVFEQWRREETATASSRVSDTTADNSLSDTPADSQQKGTLYASLQKNQELKDLVLSETPWVADADREREQRQRLADFFDENMMQQRLASAIEKIERMQRSDGSWSWWPDMPGSVYMTISVAEMLVRLNAMTSQPSPLAAQLKKAKGFLGHEMVNVVNEMKRQEKKGYKPTFPSFNALQWLYICKIDGGELPREVQQANDYLKRLLKKENRRQTIYEKALSAIILDAPGYVKSLKEYTVYQEEMGRYYDTPRAAYSWRDYRIPTQVAAIEAIQRLTPDDRQTLDEMRRWLLQQKRTQAWDTPLNSVDAVYAFLNEALRDKSAALFATQTAVMTVDDKAVAAAKPTAGIGYVKTAQPYRGEKTFTVTKQGEGTSWGAVYAQFFQTTGDIGDQGSGVSVKREIVGADGTKAAHQVGSRVTVRLTITADRDLDFVQLQDKRAACMEPVKPLSGYNWQLGCYVTPRDNTTNYFFDRLPKGKHVIETEYFIDRPGQYQTGTCTVQCAYAPEYRGTTGAVRLNIGY